MSLYMDSFFSNTTFGIRDLFNFILISSLTSRIQFYNFLIRNERLFGDGTWDLILLGAHETEKDTMLFTFLLRDTTDDHNSQVQKQCPIVTNQIKYMKKKYLYSRMC